ncbi:hypothetical protein F5879DRAFT_952910 [Lentinula edodes]|nr:hypothetical protein F5879DRAFT_952910 [Lentinula edodes]
MTATSAVAILLFVASLAIQVYAAAIPSASSPPGKFSDDLDIPSASATPHIQGLPSVSVRNTPSTAVSSIPDSTSPMHVNSMIETRTREHDYLTPRRLDGQKKNSSMNMPLDPSETEKKEEGKEKGDLKGAPPPKKQSKQQKVETERLAQEQLAERKKIKAANPPVKKTTKTTKTTPTTPNVTKVPEKKKNLNNPLVNPIINNIVYGNVQNGLGPSFSKPHPKNQKTTDA